MPTDAMPSPHACGDKRMVQVLVKACYESKAASLEISPKFIHSLRACFWNQSHVEPTQKNAAHGDVDHGLGNVQALLVVVRQPAVADHPAKRALHHPVSGHRLKAGLALVAPDDPVPRSRASLPCP